MGLGSLLAGESAPAGGVSIPHFQPRAKAVIYLFMAGGPSQLELFEHKPELERLHGQELGPKEKPEGFTAPPEPGMSAPSTT